MALIPWKSSENLFVDPWYPRRDLLPYWRRDRFWNDDSALELLSYDFERRAWELERSLHSEFVHVIPRYGINGFKVSMDVHDFLPSELTVKTNEKSIEIEGKHEEYRFGRRYVSRQFSRRYTLPPGYNANAINSELSSDGILTIKAPAPDSFQHFVNLKPSGYKAIKKVRF